MVSLANVQGLDCPQCECETLIAIVGHVFEEAAVRGGDNQLWPMRRLQLTLEHFQHHSQGAVQSCRVKQSVTGNSR